MPRLTRSLVGRRERLGTSGAHNPAGLVILSITTTAVSRANKNSHPFFLGSVRLTVYQRPFFNGTPVTGLPVGMLCLQSKAGLDHKIQYSLVLEAYVDAVVVGGAVDFNKVHGLAHDLIEAVEAAAIIATNGGLAALGDDGFEEGWKLSDFFCRLACSSGSAVTIWG